MRSAGLPDEAFSAPRLAALLGVSASVVRQWAARPTHPLAAADTASGAQRYTLAAVAEFVERNDHLTLAVKVRRRLAELTTSETATDSAAGAGATDAALAGRGRHEVGAADLAAVAQDARAALDAAMRAVARQAQLAEATARAHAEVVEELRTAVRALDGSLSALTGPSAPDL